MINSVKSTDLISLRLRFTLHVRTVRLSNTSDMGLGRLHDFLMNTRACNAMRDTAPEQNLNSNTVKSSRSREPC